MTFYNIIFGILFLGSCRQLLLLSDSVHAWTAATIAVLIFNDAVNTSQVLEGANTSPYTIFMKLLDLCNFVLLSLGLIALKPDDNPFGVKPSKQLVSLLKPWVIWSLLMVYWVLAVVWNWLAGLYQSDQWPNFMKVVSHCLVLPFAIMTVVTYCMEAPDKIPLWLRVSAFACPALYMFVLNPLGTR